MSKVSVVVPIYNTGKKLDKCIKSILHQTFTDFELILVNDGSTDDISMEICTKYEKQDARIILINKNNEGCIASRRKGVEVSTSNYIMFVDADDWIDINTIEILYNETVKNDTDITVCSDYKVIGNGFFAKKANVSTFFNEDKIYNKEQIRNELVAAYLHGHPFPAYLVAKLYKRELLLNNGKYLSRIHFLGEDLYYNLEIFLKANRIKVIDKPLYYYRTGGITSKHMPYLFDDAVSGYQIQKEIIEEYYQDTKKSRYNGISVMLLNLFKTCLNNLFNGNLSESTIRELIAKYASNDNVRECLDNEGSIKVFPKEFLNAIENINIEYLHHLGQSMYRKSLPKKFLMNVISIIS